MKKEPRSKEFLYQTITRQLTHLIQRGRLRPGEKIPSIRKTMRSQGVALITVQRAYDELMAKGLIESMPRSGYRVALPNLHSLTPPSHPSDLPMIGTNYPQKLEQLVMAQNRNQRLIPLGSATLPFELLPARALRRSLQSVLKKSLSASLSYELWNGQSELKQQIAKRWNRRGAAFTDPDQLIITSGATEAIALALRSLTQAGDLVAVESPCYFGLLEILRTLGLRALEIPTDSQSGMRLDLLENELVKSKVQAIAVNPSFQNPTGALMPVLNRKKLALLGDHLKIPIIELDTMSETHWDSEWLPPIQSFSKGHRVISCFSFSKILGPGLRVGFVHPGKYHQQFSELKRSATLASPSLAQLGIAHFMKEGGYERSLLSINQQLSRTTPQFLRLLNQILPEGSQLTQPRGGYLIWIKLPQPLDGKIIWEKCIKNGFSVTPGELFSNTASFKNYLRINAGLPVNPGVERALSLLAKELRQ